MDAGRFQGGLQRLSCIDRFGPNILFRELMKKPGERSVSGIYGGPEGSAKMKRPQHNSETSQWTLC